MKEHRVELDADDVTLDTPCGKYWFRPDGENGVVLTHQGQVFDMETVAHYMDHDLAEDLHLELAPCRPQVFYEEYCKRHEERFGEEFRID